MSDISLVRPIKAGEVKCDPRIKRFYCAMAGLPINEETVQDSLEQLSPEPALNLCPDCGGALRERNGKFGSFLGCSNHPQCRFTRNA